MFRQTPTSIYLCGPPKIGKSHLVLVLTKMINSKTSNVDNHTFCITTTTEHWDGYYQQPIVVFDDHYKLADGKQIIDASLVFNIVSCTNFFPSYAKIENKGLKFKSNFLIITSNTGFPCTVYLPQALHRRHKFHVIILPNSDKKQLDFSHLDFWLSIEIIDPWQGLYTTPFNEMHDIPFNYDEFSKFPFRKRYKKISLIQLVDTVVQDYNNEKEIFAKISDFQ